MKKRYFQYITIDKKIINEFVNKHQRLKQFVDVNNPFYVRVTKKPYPGLIHTIISQDKTSQEINSQWNQLIKLVKKISPKCIHKISLEQLSNIVGTTQANVIKNITNDIINKKINLKNLLTCSQQQIIDLLSSYGFLTINSIKTFIIFSCFQQNVLCDNDPDFIKGVEIFLDKKNIDQQDINNIKIEYEGQLTLFCLCMWKIKNERSC